MWRRITKLGNKHGELRREEHNEYSAEEWGKKLGELKLNMLNKVYTVYKRICRETWEKTWRIMQRQILIKLWKKLGALLGDKHKELCGEDCEGEVGKNLEEPLREECGQEFPEEFGEYGE